MPSRWITSSFITVVTLFAIIPVAHAQPVGCEILTKDGLADTSQTLSHKELAYSYRRWFCDKEFKTESEAETYSVNGMVPFKGVPVNLGFDASRDNWSDWSHEVCSDEKVSLWTDDIFVQNLKKINVELAKVVSDCILHSGKGLFVWLERTSEAKFKIAARFDTPIGKVRSVRMKVLLDDNVVCPSQSLALTLGSPDEHRWSCQRKKDKHGAFTTDAVQIVVNSPDITPTWGSNLSLPEVFVPPRPKSDTPFPIYVTKDMVTNCISRHKLCFAPYVDLGGVRLDKGVIFTQSPDGTETGMRIGSGGHSEATIDIPAGVHSLSFSVGDPYTGDDCADRHKKPMIMYVKVDGTTKWGPVQLRFRGPAVSGEIPILTRDRKVTLVGNTGDGPVDCDDAVWANVRFNE